MALAGCADVTAHQEPLGSGVQSPMPTAVPHQTETPQTDSRIVPTRFRVGRISAPVVPIELTDSALTPPDDPRVLGWWGKRAGSRHGTTLLTGHTVHDGGGTFDNLEDTPVGALAHLNGLTYKVTSVKVISKSQLGRRAPALFAQTGSPKLVLVTCEDYDRATGHYASNVVVTLIPEQ